MKRIKKLQIYFYLFLLVADLKTKINILSNQSYLLYFSS